MKFYHNNINVLNLDKSLEFYKKALSLSEVRRKETADFTLVFLSDKKSAHQLELTYLHDRKTPYNLGDNEIHLAMTVEDIKAAHDLHEQMGCICFENPEMGIYFISDPDGYWIEIMPAKKVLKHIVFWKFKDYAQGATREQNMAEVQKRLKALVPIIKEIKSMEIGADINSPDSQYDMALYMTFDSREDLEIYKNHPEHVKVSQFVSSVRESRVACDYYID